MGGSSNIFAQAAAPSRPGASLFGRAPLPCAARRASPPPCHRVGRRRPRALLWAVRVAEVDRVNLKESAPGDCEKEWDATTEDDRGQRPRTKKGEGGGCGAEVEKSQHARYYSLTRSSRSVWGGSEERRPPHPPRLLTPWGSNKSEEKPYIIIYVYFRVLITPRPWVRGASDGPPSRSSVLSLLWLTLIHLT